MNPYPIPRVREQLEPVVTDACLVLLDLLLAEVESAQQDDNGYVVCRFATLDQEWQLALRSQATELQALSSLARLLAICSEMIFGEAGSLDQLCLHDGFSGTLHTVGPEIAPPGLSYLPTICAPIDIGLMSYYYVDPLTKTIRFQDEGRPEVVVDTDDLVEVYLREVCQEVVPGARHRSSWLDSA